ncbi:hypothetical protein KC950_01930 [Candidatus Saccharibacteria bacterium]|nr:hypothetical protein [Candidatus Saccharibacteria bacterium]
MVIFLGFRWWYSEGWLWIFNSAVTARLKKWISYFSMPNLAKTLFAPFKQDVGKRNRSGLDALVQSFVDNSVSRIFGFIARSFLIIAGLICIFFVLISGILMIIIWPLIPAIPIISILLASGAII